MAQLREAADEAVRGMEDAQAECRWLHGQLQAVLREAGSGKGTTAERRRRQNARRRQKIIAAVFY